MTTRRQAWTKAFLRTTAIPGCLSFVLNPYIMAIRNEPPILSRVHTGMHRAEVDTLLQEFERSNGYPSWHDPELTVCEYSGIKYTGIATYDRSSRLVQYYWFDDN